MSDTAALPGSARTPWQWMFLPFSRFAVLQGRSPRAEYWWFALLGLVVDMVAYVIDYGIDHAGLLVGHGGYFGMIAVVVLLLPQITVSVRRLHDVGRSGWWLLAPVGVAFAAGVAAGTTSGDIGGTGLSAVTVGLLAATCAALVMIFVWSVTRGTIGDNRYGPDPLAT